MKTPFTLYRGTILPALLGGALLLSPVTTANAQVTPGHYVGSMKIISHFDDDPTGTHLETSTTFKVHAHVLNDTNVYILAVPLISVADNNQAFRVTENASGDPVFSKVGEGGDLGAELTQKGKHLKIIPLGTDRFVVNLVRKGD